MLHPVTQQLGCRQWTVGNYPQRLPHVEPLVQLRIIKLQLYLIQVELHAAMFSS